MKHTILKKGTFVETPLTGRPTRIVITRGVEVDPSNPFGDPFYSFLPCFMQPYVGQILRLMESEGTHA